MTPSVQLRVTVLLFVLVTAVNLATPRGAGPDEPSHMIRAAGLVRGDVRGTAGDDPHAHTFDVPGWVGQPDPACYAFSPDQGASCASVVDDPTPSSTAWSYPLLGHIAPGLGSLLPGEARTMWVSRALHTLTCVVLVGAALARLLATGRRVTAAAVLLALTPTAIFSMAVVNPSGLAIAGAIGMWVFGAELLRRRSAGAPIDRASIWWLAASWCAAVLPRDDGLMWAALIAIALLAAHRVRPADLVSTVGTPALAVIGVGSAAALAWFLFARTELVPIPVDQRGWDLLRLVVDRTGAHLDEAIGNLGWLDTPIPTLAIGLWWAAAGLLVGANLARGRIRMAALPVIVLAATLVVSWTIEFVQAPDSGLFWQGRYSLPLFVGIVLVADAEIDGDALAGRRLAQTVSGVAVVCWVLSMFQLQRRFGVGINGSWAPWEWDDWANPLPSVVVLVVFCLAAAGLAWTIDQAGRPVAIES